MYLIQTSLFGRAVRRGIKSCGGGKVRARLVNRLIWKSRTPLRRSYSGSVNPSHSAKVLEPLDLLQGRHDGTRFCTSFVPPSDNGHT